MATKRVRSDTAARRKGSIALGPLAHARDGIFIGLNIYVDIWELAAMPDPQRNAFMLGMSRVAAAFNELSGTTPNVIPTAPTSAQ